MLKLYFLIQKIIKKCDWERIFQDRENWYLYELFKIIGVQNNLYTI